MSTKSKASGNTSGCCTRQTTLKINSFTQQVYGVFDLTLGDPSGPINPSGLDGPLNTVPLIITSNASDQCKEKVRIQIVQLMRAMIRDGFKEWLQTSPQADLVKGLFKQFTLIRFMGVTFPWEFEIECCDRLQTGSIITNYKSFPTLVGIRLISSDQNNTTQTWLTPPIVCTA